MISLTMLKKPNEETRRMSERRVYWRWYDGRWRYLHAAWHLTRTRRYDGRDRFFWLALGPLDMRWHIFPRACRGCGIRLRHSIASVLCPTCSEVRPMKVEK